MIRLYPVQYQIPLLAQGLPCLTAAYGGAIAAGAAAERAAAEKGEYAPTALDTIRHIAL